MLELLIFFYQEKKYLTIQNTPSLSANVGKLWYLSAGDARQSYGYTNTMKISEKLFLKFKVLLQN